MTSCSHHSCDRDAIARGLCGKHYQKWNKSNRHLVSYQASAGEPLKWLQDHVSYSSDECLKWPFAYYPTGYGLINLNPLNKKSKATMASRYMCFLANGNPPTKDYQAAHSCGNGHKGCVNPKHLSWKTRSDNEKDKIIHGTSNRGSGNGQSILDEEKVIQIRNSTKNRGLIAEEFGVSLSTVYDIKSKRSWAWL